MKTHKNSKVENNNNNNAFGEKVYGDFLGANKSRGGRRTRRNRRRR
jgi:hypothetical protein